MEIPETPTPDGEDEVGDDEEETFGDPEVEEEE